MILDFPIFTESMLVTTPMITPMARLGFVQSNGFNPGAAYNVPPERYVEEMLCGPMDSFVKRCKDQFDALPAGHKALFLGGWLFARDPKLDQVTHDAYMTAAVEGLKRYRDFGVIPNYFIHDIEGEENETAQRVRALLYDTGIYDYRTSRFCGWQLYDGHGPQKDEYTRPDQPKTLKRKMFLPDPEFCCVHGYRLPETGQHASGVSLEEQNLQIINQCIGSRKPFLVLTDGFTHWHGESVPGDGGITDDKWRQTYIDLARVIRDIPNFRGVWIFQTSVGSPVLNDPTKPELYPPGMALGNVDLQILDEAGIVQAWRGNS